MIWAALSLLLLLAILVMLIGPKQNHLSGTKESAIAHFKEQLAALEADKKSGKISAEDFETNKVEISRHLLRESEKKDSDVLSSSMTLQMSIAIAFFIAAGTFAFYSQVGKPNLKSAPYTQMQQTMDQKIAGSNVSFGQALDKMEQDLAKDPSNKKLLALYARTLGQLEQYKKAYEAYEILSKAEPANIQWRIAMIENSMGHTGGQITPASDLMIDQLLYKLPTAPAGHYLKGLMHMQQGDTDEALTVWEAYAKTSPPDAPWMRSFMPQIRALKYPTPKLDPEQVQRVMSLGAIERNAFFKSMADRLEARITPIGDYPEAWLRLAQVRMMIGDKAAAKIALETGIRTSSDPAQAVPLRQMLDKIMESGEN